MVTDWYNPDQGKSALYLVQVTTRTVQCVIIARMNFNDVELNKDGIYLHH